MSQQPNWAGRTCVVLASGPSLTREQVMHAMEDDVQVIAVNSTFRLAPLADVVYAGDFMWWKTHINEVRKKMPISAELWTQDSTAAERYYLNRIKGVNRPGLGKALIHSNGNSGAQAVNLAYLFGCRRILLLGFDMKLGPRGEKHWHEDHPGPLMQAQCFNEWTHKFEPLAKDLKAAGCEVINCTPGSALTCFPMSKIEEEL